MFYDTVYYEEIPYEVAYKIVGKYYPSTWSDPPEYPYIDVYYINCLDSELKEGKIIDEELSKDFEQTADFHARIESEIYKVSGLSDLS